MASALRAGGRWTTAGISRTTRSQKTSSSPAVQPRFTGPEKKRLDVLFVGESGGVEECAQGLAFVGPSGSLLKSTLDLLDPKGHMSVGYDNVCRDNLGYGKPDLDSLTDASRPVKELRERSRPRCTVLCGEYALRAFGIPGAPTSLAGLEVEPGILGSVHPAYVLRNPGEGIYLTAVLNQIRRMVCPVGDVDTVPGIVRLTNPADFDAHRCTRAVSEKFAFDLETTSLDHRTGRVLTASFCDSGGLACWYNVDGQTKRWNAVKRYVKRPGFEPIFHHAKFEAAWLGWESLHPRWHCTMIRQHLVDENHPVSLNWMARLLGFPYYWKGITYDDMVGQDREKLGIYNAWDAAVAWQAFQYQEEYLSRDQQKHLRTCLYPFASVLMKMQDDGVYVDDVRTRKIVVQCKAKAARKQKRLDGWAGEPVNVRSHPQLLDIFQNRLKLKWPHQTQKHKPSLDKEALAYLAPKHPRATDIADIRFLRDKVSRVCEPLLKARDLLGLVHTTFTLGVVVTGRLSSQNPNLQNIDRDGPEREVFRSRFKAGKIVRADAMHHELRVLASYCKDPNLLRIFREGRDPHQEFADCAGATRQQGKITNFQVASGGGPYTIAKVLGCDRVKATELRDRWYENYPQAQLFHSDIKAELEDTGEIRLRFGRVRHLPHIHASDEATRASAVRQALNCPIQATGADVVALWAVNVARAFRKGRLQSLLCLTTHDDLVVDSYPGELTRVRKILSHGLKSIDIGVPLDVEIKVGEHL